MLILTLMFCLILIVVSFTSYNKAMDDFTDDVLEADYKAKHKKQ